MRVLDFNQINAIAAYKTQFVVKTRYSLNVLRYVATIFIIIMSTTNSVSTFGTVDRCVITDNMASCSDSVSGSHTNSLSNRSDSHVGNEFEPNEIKGYLMKRARLTRKWKRVYFVLKNCDLLYYSNPEVRFFMMTPLSVSADECCLPLLMSHYVNFTVTNKK